MRILMLAMLTVSALVRANPVGMYNTSATSALKMVPPVEVHADALEYKYARTSRRRLQLG